jgi:hypothetical protein
MIRLEQERLDVICALRLGEIVVRRRAHVVSNPTLRAEREAKADRMAGLRSRLERDQEAAA